jgi:uncharacterized protein YjiS (DUF1127 family)
MSNFTSYPLSEVRGSPRPSLVGRAVSRLVDRIVRFRAVNELEQLSDRQLRDIGVDRRQIAQIAEREIARLRER